MKKTLLFTFITLFFCIAGKAQINLVPNPSFENYTLCPNTYYMLPTDWYTCSGTPDYYNSCDTTWGFGVPLNWAGNIQASDGRAYCGFVGISYESIPCGKEYLGCQLINPLQINHKYFLSFKVCYAEWPAIASNNIGLLLSTKSYQIFHPYNIDSANIPTINFAHVVDIAIIQDSTNWTTISGSVIADSAYQYLLIGDFFDSAQTSVVIFNHNNFFQQQSYYYVDEVCVSEDSLTCNVIDNLKVYNDILNKICVMPNPFNFSTVITIRADIDINNIMIYDIMGRNVTSAAILTEIIKNKNISQIDLIKGKLCNGIYVLKIISGNFIFSKKLIINN